MSLLLRVLLPTLLLAAAAEATPTTIAYTGVVGFANPDAGLDGSVRLGTPLSGTLVVDLDAPVPDRPDDPNFPTQGLHWVQVDAFQLLVGGYTLGYAGGLGSLVIYDEDPAFGSDLARLSLDALTSVPSLTSGGTLSVLFDFGDETRQFVTDTGLHFPLDLGDWTSAGFAVRESVPGVGLETKFLGFVSSWQVVPEPGTASLLGGGLVLLGSLARLSSGTRRRRRRS